ncbi:MAG: hypothetical protein V1866_03795 [archaeon]
MKTKYMILLLLALGVVLSLLPGCKVQQKQNHCASDGDCACGTNSETGECFYGYKTFVNVEKQCPDFCTGIAGMFEIKCVNNECKQVKKEAVPAECAVDEDCVPEQCCHATSCIAASKKGVCNLACTMNCAPNSLDCGGSCACESGKCVAHFLSQ